MIYHTVIFRNKSEFYLHNKKEVTEKEKLGIEFKRLREKIPSSEHNNCISQQELADTNIGLTKYSIGAIERGDANPTLEKLVFFAKSLNLKTINILNVEIIIDKFINELSNGK